MFRTVLMSLLLTTILVGCKAETVNEMTDVVKTEETVEKIQSLTSVSVPDGATAAETLLYATGADITFKSMMILSVDEMMRAVSQSGQKVDKAELDRMVQIGNAEVEDMLPEIISDLGEIYEKHFTDAEMLEMAAFFQSGAGRKFVDKQPVITGEAVGVGQEIGQKLLQRIETRLGEE